MGMFDNMTVDDNIKEEGDSLRGGKFDALSSALYPLTIKNAYVSISKGGATAINVSLETEDGRIVKDQQWVTSGTKKGCKNFYYVKDKDKKETKEKAYLPGFNAINALCLLTVGKTLPQMETAERTLKIYDYVAKAEIPTDVQMLVELIGQKVVAGVLHQIVDKNAKNEQTGEYEPTGKIRNTNSVDKYFRERDMMTVNEIKSGVDEGAFFKEWENKWKDQIDDQSTEVKTAGKAGSPATGAAAAQTNIFA